MHISFCCILLQILQTMPFDKVKIEIISIHLHDELDNVADYVAAITKFLYSKSYKLQKRFGHNYFYQRFNYNKQQQQQITTRSLLSLSPTSTTTLSTARIISKQQVTYDLGEEIIKK